MNQQSEADPAASACLPSCAVGFENGLALFHNSPLVAVFL
jgi:hypothetical protein